MEKEYEDAVIPKCIGTKEFCAKSLLCKSCPFNKECNEQVNGGQPDWSGGHCVGGHCE